MCAHCHTAPPADALAPDALRTLRGIGHVRRRAKALNRSLTEEALAAEWRLVTVAKKAGERPIEEAARREFRREAREVLGALPSVSRSLVFDLDGWARGMAAEIGAPTVEAIRAGFEAAAARLGVEEVAPFRPDDPRVRTTLRSILGKTSDIAETTADRLTRTLMEGVGAGEDLDALAARVRAVFESASVHRSRAIAQTAGTGAYERGQQVGFAEAGVGRRRWLSARLPTTRPAHFEADGQEVGVEEPFSVGGESLMFPADPAGSAGNTIFCYCTVLPLL